jgi:hypothetical protein
MASARPIHAICKRLPHDRSHTSSRRRLGCSFTGFVILMAEVIDLDELGTVC